MKQQKKDEVNAVFEEIRFPITKPSYDGYGDSVIKLTSCTVQR